MSLKNELERRRAAVAKALPAEDLRVIRDTVERLRMLQLAEHSLAPGDHLPDLALPDDAGRIVTSGELLAQGPLVVAFFRGGWCPFCDAALEALEGARPTLEALGCRLVGISPLRPEELAHLRDERGLGFSLLSDVGGQAAERCGVRYDLAEEHIEFYRRQGIDLPKLHGDASWALPIPATYVVRPDGVVAFAFGNPDWACRAEPEELVAVVREIARSGDDGAEAR